MDVRIDLVPRWREGDLDRLRNRAHSSLHESVARMFGEAWSAWILAPEVSFSIYGERGVIDILVWHPGRRSILVVELKTDIVDVNELSGHRTGSAGSPQGSQPSGAGTRSPSRHG